MVAAPSFNDFTHEGEKSVYDIRYRDSHPRPRMRESMALAPC